MTGDAATTPLLTTDAYLNIPRQADVVALRVFGGWTLEETADALDVSTDTVKRDWRFAKLWLLRELREKDPA